MNPQHSDRQESPSLAPKFQPIEDSWDTKPGPLEAVGQAGKSKTVDDSRSLLRRLKTPLMVRGDALRNALGLATLPAAVCAQLASFAHRVGGALLATVEELDTVPLREIPFRMAPIDSHSMPSLDALISADALELELGDRSLDASRAESESSLSRLRVDWPLDVPDMPRFSKKIGLLRELTQNSIPVGVAVPIGDTSTAGIERFRWLSEIGIDFVTIRTAGACLGNQHPALPYFSCDPIDVTRRVRALLDRPGKPPIEIALDYPWVDGYQAGQAILAGASLIVADGYLAQRVPPRSESMNLGSADSLASGWLGRSGLPAVPSPTQAVSHLLQRVDWPGAFETFTQQLRSSLEF